MLDGDVLGKLALELLMFRAENELSVIQHRLDAAVHAFADALVLSLEIDEIHGDANHKRTAHHPLSAIR